MLIFVVFTSQAYAYDVPELNMEITVPNGYRVFDELEENEYACFISHDKKQYISVRMTENADTYSLKGFNDAEIGKIANDITDTTQGSETEIYRTKSNIFFKVRNADRDIYYTFANGQCISIASIDMVGNSPTDISAIIDTAEIKDNFNPMPFDIYLLFIVGGAVVSVALLTYAIIFYIKRNRKNEEENE